MQVERDDPKTTPEPRDAAPAGAVAPEETVVREDDLAPSAEDQRVEHLLAHSIDLPELASAVEQQEAPDAADTLEQLEEEQAAELLEQMDDRSAAGALSEMETPLAVGVIEDLIGDDPVYAGRLLDLMAPDDAADLLQALEPESGESLLSAMPATEAATLRRLMRYDRESAGGLMTTEFVALRSTMTVAQATEEIRQRRIPEHMDHLPVVSGRGELVGSAALRTLLLAGSDDRIAAIMDPDVRSVGFDTDQEEVARRFARYDLTMLPVVDERDNLLGVVTVDDVIDILREEQTEDVQMTVGAGAGEAVYSGLGVKFRGRFPWLTASLIMTGMAAVVVLLFEDLITRMPVLAFLMPVIAALVGNAGHQALAVTLRGIVLQEVRPDRVWPLVLREAIVGLLNGMVLGLLLCAGVALLSLRMSSASWQLGVVAALATTIAMGVGTVAGTAVPQVMRRVGIDPAHASTIFLIFITDGISFTVLLGLTFLMLGRAAAT